MISLAIFFISTSSFAQNCPPNIDFELGTFREWTCYTGFTSAVNNENIISLSPSNGPIYNKHTMYNANSTETDPFGHFPVLCPNGSGHSVRLGSTEAGGEAEGISYEFTIPANRNDYSLTYYYAVVFQSPNHKPFEQPRMQAEVTNVTDGSVISCASFSFIAVGSSIPGFQVSDLSDTTNVLYKNWSPVTVDLSGNAGKRIKLFFKTADCTFRRHFGYAYIDVNSDCSGKLPGANYCPDDTIVHITAPYGYQSYRWYDSSLTHLLDTSQTLALSPPPVSGTTFAVKLQPYDGFGCPSTLFSKVTDSLTVKSDAGRDALSCNGDTLQIGTMPTAGFVYNWTPATGLTNPDISNPFAAPVVTTDYIVTTNSLGGGCRSTDTVHITASVINNTLRLLGKDAYCFGHGDSAVLNIDPENNIEWFKDELGVDEASGNTVYRVNTSGTYYAVLTNEMGCTIATEKKPILVEYDKAGINYPLKYAIVNLPLELAARPIGVTAIWSPAIYLSNAGSFGPTFQSTSLLQQLYNITITSRGGCITVDTQLVKVVPHAEIYVPSAFTPNSDGRNDYLHPIFRGIAEVKTFKIFNRWGNLLFESSTELPGWDGNFKGIPQDGQTVVWMLECVGLDRVVYSKRGTSLLIR